MTSETPQDLSSAFEADVDMEAVRSFTFNCDAWYDEAGFQEDEGNFAPVLGHTDLRRYTAGSSETSPTPEEAVKRAVEDLVGIFGQLDPFELGLALVVEQAQLDLGGVGREECEVDARPVPGRAEARGRAFPQPVAPHDLRGGRRGLRGLRLGGGAGFRRRFGHDGPFAEPSMFLRLSKGSTCHYRSNPTLPPRLVDCSRPRPL